MSIVLGFIVGIFIIFLLLLSAGAMFVKSKIPDISKLGTFESSNMPASTNTSPSGNQPNKLKQIPNTVVNPKINTNPDYNAKENCTYKQVDIDGIYSRLCYNATDLNALNTVLYQLKFSLSRIEQTKALLEQYCSSQYASDRDFVESQSCRDYETTLDTHTTLIGTYKNLINSIKERGKP